jgi:glyoxylase-like metal-dependent hydrolase (beta-lactamase superfamily II)
MSEPEPIDLRHQDQDHVIGVYLLDTQDGLALVDCGPASCLGGLERGLAERGVGLADLRHLLLTHIHLDHAGAAGALVRRNGSLQVHVSPVGAPHLIDPSRLERSARRLYGRAFDTLWGELAPVPEENVHAASDRVAGCAAFPTPGHASHHVCYLDGDGTLYAGDAAGVRIQPGRFVVPHAPPPDIDIEAWLKTLDEIERRQPVRLAPIHFGLIHDPAEHLTAVRERLVLWAERARTLDEATFVELCEGELREAERERADRYLAPASVEQSYRGLRRYWDKRAEREAADGPR